jgi:hypothetical protein
MFKGGKPSARYIPGAGIPGAPPKQPVDGKKKKNKKKANGGDQVLVEEMGKATIELAPVVEVPATDDAAAKKVRNLEKKVSPCFESQLGMEADDSSKALMNLKPVWPKARPWRRLNCKRLKVRHHFEPSLKLLCRSD